MITIIESLIGETAIDDGDEIIVVPGDISISNIYPNPFNMTTTIEFTTLNTAPVTFMVYDLLGREVEMILNQAFDSGNHKVQWNASNVPSGIYFVGMRSGDFTQTRKMLLLK
ncbi:MAG: T9SS type A sorting domain-containing protein [Candidatus Neomarinimicrobiota bacterium]